MPVKMKMMNAIESENIRAVLRFLMRCAAKFLMIIVFVAREVKKRKNQTTNFSNKYWKLKLRSTNPSSIPQRIQKNIASSKPILKESNARGSK